LVESRQARYHSGPEPSFTRRHPSTHEQSKLIEQLRRRIVVGNIIGYTGMVGALLIYFSQAPVHPFLYAAAGVAVGVGTGLAYLSLFKIKRLRDATGNAARK
jgi:hypothetical protein